MSNFALTVTSVIALTMGINGFSHADICYAVVINGGLSETAWRVAKFIWNF